MDSAVEFCELRQRNNCRVVGVVFVRVVVVNCRWWLKKFKVEADESMAYRWI